jgi:hypothetical protein
MILTLYSPEDADLARGPSNAGPSNGGVSNGESTTGNSDWDEEDLEDLSNVGLHGYFGIPGPK